MRRTKRPPSARPISSPPPTGSLSVPAPAWAAWLAPALLVLAGLAAYSNSFRCPFLLDDRRSIVDNPVIRQPLHYCKAIFTGSRPVVTWTLAFNYAVSGLEVWSYHAVNLAIHLLAALTLYGLVKRTLLLKRFGSRYERSAPGLALAAALLWLLHPLATQSVTYIVQRGESLMGLFYLLTLYCLLRGATAVKAQRRWYAAAVLSCALGMGSKEVMATVPLAALLYDRAFLSPSWREVFRRRWGLYLPLAAVVVLAVVLGQPLGERLLAGRPLSQQRRRLVAAAAVGTLAVTLGLLTFLRNEDYQTVLSIWQDTLRKRPRNPRAHASVGAELLQAGDIPGAIRYFAAAIAIPPALAQPWFSRGFARAQLGEHQQAMADYTRALEIDPSHALAHYHRGLAHGQLHQYRQAIADYTRAIELRPLFARAYFARSVGYLNLEEYDEAWADVHRYRSLGEEPDPQVIELLMKRSGRKE